jgi:hypothetical protein
MTLMPHSHILEIRSRSGLPRCLFWYKGFFYQGDFQNIVEFMENLVRRKSLYEDLDHLLIVSGIGFNQENCFFIPINSIKMKIPTNIQKNVVDVLLKKRHFIIQEINQVFYYNEVMALTRSQEQVQVHQFIPHSIPYQSAAQIREHRSPFEATLRPSAVQTLTPADIETKSINCDRLLYWLSALGSGTWDSFTKVCDTLQIDEPKRILRRLRLLGHIESSVNGKRWSVAPTTLVKIESNSDNPEYILCGQRSLKLLDHLKKYAQLKFIPQPGGAAPHCIRLQVCDPHLITKNSDFPVVNVGEASLQLAELLPDIKIWQEQLTTLPGIVPSLYQWQKFNCQTNQFEESYPEETGLYELRREANPNYRRTLFYDRERNAWLQGDWYGLRFLCLQHSGQECRAHYNGDTNRLTIKDTQRWPEIYELALVLASGLLPSYQTSGLGYENAGVEQVVLLSDRLYVTF